MILYFVGMVLLKLLVFVAIGLGIYKLVAYIHQHYHSRAGGIESSAIETLKKRFARGEIDEEEYRAKLRVLRA